MKRKMRMEKVMMTFVGKRKKWAMMLMGGDDEAKLPEEASAAEN